MAWESFDEVRFGLGPLLHGVMMVHWLWLVVFLVDTNFHRFSDVLGLVDPWHLNPFYCGQIISVSA